MKAAVAIASLAAVALAGCGRFSRPAPVRLLRVRAVADAAFRRSPGWRQVIVSRVEWAAQQFAVFHITLESVGSAEWDPDPQATTEENRRRLGGSENDGSWIFLGFTAPPAEGGASGAEEPGAAQPFDPRILVFDYPGRGERANSANLAHEMAHAFGAWHSRDSRSLMHLPLGTDFDAATRACFGLTESFDTRAGIAAMDPDALSQLQQIWARSRREPSSNPVYRGWATAGYERLGEGRLGEAVDFLSRAAALQPNEAGPHRALATAYMALRRYRAAAEEFRGLSTMAGASGGAWNSLALALVRAGEPEEALEALHKASRATPDSAALHTNLGLVLEHLPGRMEEAIAELEHAVALDPEDEAARACLRDALAARAADARPEGRGRINP